MPSNGLSQRLMTRAHASHRTAAPPLRQSDPERTERPLVGHLHMSEAEPNGTILQSTRLLNSSVYECSVSDM